MYGLRPILYFVMRTRHLTHEEALALAQAHEGHFGAQSLLLDDPQKIVELTFAKGASSFEDSLLSGVRAEVIVDSPVLRNFLQTLSPRTDGIDYVFNQNLLDPVNWQPS
jgi:hypothetical protein